MMDPPRELSKLSEGEFRTRVLIPLLKAMGYRDVDHHHGAGELGKDITAWKQTDDGARQHYAVVAKKGRINAKAAGDAGTVATQIRQAFGIGYSDPLTGEPRSVHSVIVATTGAIPDQSRKAIWAQIDAPHRPFIRFWSGDKIAELLSQYLPAPSLGEAVDRLEQQLDRIEALDVEATVSAEGTVLRVRPRTPGEEVAHLNLKFPETKEGRHAAQNARRFFEEGGSITIPNEYIESFEVHEELKSLFGCAVPEWLRLEQSLGNEFIPIRLSPIDSNAPPISGLVLRAWRAGSKQATFRTPKDDTVWVELTLRRNESLTLRMHSEVSTYPVHRAYQTVLFWNALARGSGLEVRHERTNQRLFYMGQVPDIEAPEPALIEMLAALAYVEERLNISLTLPERMDDHALASALELRDSLRDGQHDQSYEAISFESSTEQARNLLGITADGSPTPLLLVHKDAQYDLFDVSISLGPIARDFRKVSLEEHHREQLIESMRSGNERHPVTLTPHAEGVVTTHLLRFKDSEALAQFKEEFPKIDPDALTDGVGVALARLPDEEVGEEAGPEAGPVEPPR